MLDLGLVDLLVVCDLVYNLLVWCLRLYVWNLVILVGFGVFLLLLDACVGCDLFDFLVGCGVSLIKLVVLC